MITFSTSFSITLLNSEEMENEDEWERGIIVEMEGNSDTFVSILIRDAPWFAQLSSKGTIIIKYHVTQAVKAAIKNDNLKPYIFDLKSIAENAV